MGVQDTDIESAATVAAGSPTADPVALSPQQVLFFHTFGFLHLPGLLADEIGTITEGFDEVFASDTALEYRHDLHFNQPREMIGPKFVERSPKLSWLRHDPRIVGIVESLIAPEHDYNDSDGNLFSCDTGWHSDIFGATMERLHIKLYFYLDALRADTGALRLMPGTNASGTPYADAARSKLWSVDGPEQEFGIDPREIPSWTVETDPGDVVIGDYRTLHATFGGAPRRRLFTMNFSARPDAVVRRRPSRVAAAFR